MQLTFEAKNLKEAASMLLGINENIDDLKRRMLVSIAITILEEIKTDLMNAGHVFTGELIESLQIFEEGEDYVIIGSDAQQAWYIEYGRGPVKPVHKKFLRWIDKNTGEFVFAKYAKKFEGTHIFQSAITKNARPFGLTIVNAMKELVNTEAARAGVKP